MYVFVEDLGWFGFVVKYLFQFELLFGMLYKNVILVINNNCMK